MSENSVGVAASATQKQEPRGTLHGNDCIDRPETDTNSNVTFVDQEARIGVDGHITAFRIFAKRTNPVELVIYRKTGDAFSIVGRSPAKTPASVGVQEFALEVPIEVKAGDLIGWHDVQAGAIAFVYAGAANRVGFALSHTPTTMVGWGGRIYSIQVRVEAAKVDEPAKPPAQSISGIVNVSAAATSIAGETLTLGGTTNPLKAGDRVVIIQMAGAYIDTSDNERFGTITSDNGAGRYVWATVVGTNGQNVKLAESFGGFDTATGKVQVVRAYSSAGDVTVAGRIDVPAWDGSSGGVIVLESGGTLKIAAEMDVSGKGFKGGRVSHNNGGGTARGYVYAESNLAGIKGEGIAAMSGDRAGGRGAPANAGGGGNEHNSGGGGGGNGGAGGRGGFEYYSQTGDTNGIGGRSLDYPDRAFFGGGGGGGQQNNGQGTGGGAGGGLVILRAQSIVGSTGGAIRANGANGPDAGWDGAGGGGAGGTIVLDATSVTGEFILEARGGKGGATPWGQGEGGGGGGGTIRTNATLPPSVKASLGGGDPGRTGAGGTTGAQGIVGPLVPSKPGSPSGTSTSCAQCDKVREELGKKLAERDQKCAAYEQKVDAIDKKLDTIEKKLTEQERSNIDQERRLLEQDRKIATQEKSNLEQERKLLEQDKKLAEQERSNLEQEKRLFEQDKKIAELAAKTDNCNACNEKLSEQAKAINELTNKLADLEAKATKCGACEETLTAQTKTIADLTAKLDDLTKKLAELTSKLEQKTEPPTKADDLEAIEGIGPKIADLLKNAGIRTYKDLAAIDVAELKKILKTGGTQFARNDPSSWPKQAQLILASDKPGLKALQDKLRAGRDMA
ncbi:MAG TPA: helix-hairpin-helix domain-containing protein [Polyangium sp.]|nr:helix-hairpin-helix domain-containing protein [Polyangium sp.]